MGATRIEALSTTFANSGQGNSIALSMDGNTALETTNSAALVFVRNELGDWTGITFVFSKDIYGSAIVALNGDGSIAMMTGLNILLDPVFVVYEIEKQFGSNALCHILYPESREIRPGVLFHYICDVTAASDRKLSFTIIPQFPGFHELATT